MANQVLNNILEEEKKAADLLKEALQGANELVKNAEAQATEAERKGAVEHRALFQSILEERRKKVERTLKDQQTSQPNADQAALNASKARMGEAVDAIVEGVLNGHR